MARVMDLVMSADAVVGDARIFLSKDMGHVRGTQT
jgi:hypothetical protein